MWPAYTDAGQADQVSDFMNKRSKRAAAKAFRTQLDVVNNSVDDLSLKKRQGRENGGSHANISIDAKYYEDLRAKQSASMMDFTSKSKAVDYAEKFKKIRDIGLENPTRFKSVSRNHNQNQ